MIHSFADKSTQSLYNGKRVKKFQAFERQAQKRLTVLEAATCIEDLMRLPSNRLEALTGDRNGQFSIMINKQWRICFNWREAPPGAENVEITDYH
jgi:proteic killer suppression protein